jgi:hypothetical protein
MLSGTGPKSHRADMGIDTMRNLPGVGLNLHDLALSRIAYQPTRAMPPISDLAFPSPASAGEGNASLARRRGAPEFAAPRC